MKRILLGIALSLLALQPALAKGPGEHGHKGDHGDLPPGLQKKRELPPGWQKKLNRGERLDDELYSHAVPLTPMELARLPPPPPNVIQMRIEDHIVQMEKTTRRIREVLHLP